MMTVEAMLWILTVATTLLALALLFDRLLARRWPLGVAAMWNALLVAVVILPAATLLAPRFELPILPPRPLVQSDIAPDDTKDDLKLIHIDAPIPAVVSPRGTKSVAGSEPGSGAPAPPAHGSRDSDAAGIAQAATATANHPIPASAPPWRRVLLQMLAAFYFFGVAVAIVRLAASWRAVVSLRRAATRVAQRSWLDRFEHWQGRLAFSPRVDLLTGDAVSVPIALGIARPAIVIPSALASERNQRTIDAVLVHELAHVRRADCAWQLLERIVAALLWFHPLVWVAGRRMALARERACDDFAIHVLADRDAYAETLVEMAARLARRRGLGLDMAVVRAGNLARRLAAIEHSAGSTRCTLSPLGRLTFIGTGALLTMAFASVTLVRAVAEEPELPAPPVTSAKSDKPADQRLDPSADKKPDTPAGSSLLVRTVEAQTGQPVTSPAVVVTRADNLLSPGWRLTGGSETNLVTFDGLPAGPYEVTANRRAHSPDQWELKTVDGPGKVVIEPGTNAEIELKLKAARLTEDEIDQRWPWVATGRVVDEHGRPVAGATVRAATGMGTLLGGGRTTTGPDGRYTLRFGQGISYMDNDVQLQIALFFASKPGYYEKNLCRQGAFAMARRELKPDELRGLWRNKHEIILPGKPQTIDFELAPAATIVAEFVDANGQELWDNRLTLLGPELPPGSNVLEQGQIERGKFTAGDVPPGFPFWWSVMVTRNKGVRSPSFVLPGPGRYRMQLKHLHDEVTGLDLLEIESVIGPRGNEVKTEAMTDDPLWHAPAKQQDQARGREILKRLGEVNRYWLGPPPDLVKSYSYDFNFAGGKTESYTVDDPRVADRRVRQGINFTSATLRLVENRDKLVFQIVDVTPERIRLMYRLKAISHPRWQFREGVTGSHRGGSDGAVWDGVIDIDAARFVPLEVREDPPRDDGYRETFGDFVEICPGHYVPRKIRISGPRSCDWTFNVYEPGLWLFSASRDTRYEDAPPPTTIDNVIVNGKRDSIQP